MRVIFMGTPDFAAVSLEKLITDGNDICAVFSQPDKASGRGMDIRYSPVKECALKHHIPVFQPVSLRDPEVQSTIIALHADVIAVVAYGKLLPVEVLESARFGAINLHGSLLPKYRGAAPIQWSVLNGDKKTGVCTFYLTPEMDAGDLIYSEETEIGEMETSGELYDRLKIIGANLLSRTLLDVGSGIAPRVAQDQGKASYVTRLSKDLSPIDWDQTPREIVKWICGLQPWPVATMCLQGKTVKVYRAEYSDRKTDAKPGTIVSAGKQGIEIACKNGECLFVTEIQVPGKKRMRSSEYLLGHPMNI